jgi:hypothetical protein
MKLILSLSVPAILGFTSWVISWAFAFAPFRHTSHAHDVQMTFGLIFAVMTWIGPFTAILAIIALHRSSSTLAKRVAWYLLNAAWGMLSLVILVHFWLAHRG